VVIVVATAKATKLVITTQTEIVRVYVEVLLQACTALGTADITVVTATAGTLAVTATRRGLVPTT
jgi:hypothetical protein